MDALAPPHESGNALEAISREIGLRILRGEYAPGTNLPPLRALAEAHGVTLPTMQRVVARLEAQGLVSVRHGSGVAVLDAARQAELSLLPLWFEALGPDRAGDLLADLLAVRRVVAGHLVAVARERVFAALPRLAAILADLHGTTDLARRVDLDLRFTAALVEATGNLAAKAVFRSIERLIREVPWIAEAFYGDAADHDATQAAMAAALAAPDVAQAIDRALADWDARAVARYRRLARPPSTQGP